MSTNGAGAIDRFTPLERLPQFLSPEEARVVLNVSRTAIYEILRRGELEHVRFGRIIRIPRDALVRTGANDKATR